MTALLPSAGDIASFLLTYLIHSTLLVLLIGLALRCWSAARSDLRVMLWKTALVVPVVTSLAASLVASAHVGLQFSIVKSFKSEAVVELTDSPSAIPTNVSLRDSEREESTEIVTEKAALAPQDVWTTSYSQAGAKTAFPAWLIITLVCLAGSVIGCIRLGVQARRLGSLRRRSPRMMEPSICAAVDRLSRKAGLPNRIDVLQSVEIHGPVTAGIVRPFILVPCAFMDVLSPDERDALFAHELVHVARRDALWKLIGQMICRVFFFQPLNHFARRQLEFETEFVVDEQAARLLDECSGLAGCLARLGEWLVNGPVTAASPRPLAVGMAAFRSTLGRRVETLLTDDAHSKPSSRLARRTLELLVICVAIAAITVAPRAVADSATETTSDNKDESMKRQLATIAVLTGLALPATAEDEKQTKAQPERPAITKTTADELPDGIARFNGMLVGRLVKKDVEKGTFIVNVDAVPRVWRNSKAENPKSLIGKNVEVDGVTGKWLDVLLLVKEGETLEFESRHDGGNRLTFPGELLRKVAPYEPADYPVLPEDFRGFQGAIAAKVVKKDPETFELIVQVDRVIDTWKNNSAKKPASIEGKQMMLAGFWQRKDAYHGLKVGDQIEVGMQHIGLRSDHLTVAEFVRKAGERADREERPRTDKPKDEQRKSEEASAEGFPAGMRGFRGILVGQLVSKDVEKGEFVLRAESAPRVWPKNEAKDPKSCKGREFTLRGVSGKFLDVLVQVKPGDRLEVEAMHNRGEYLDFPGELLRKVE